jgi:hypothetical protein
MHIDTSSIKIIQSYAMHAHAQAYAHLVCHFHCEANSAVGGLPSLPGAVTPFLVMQEANSAVGGLPTTTGSRHPVSRYA